MNDAIAVYLDLAAAKAKQLAMDYRSGRLWEGDIQAGIGEITQNLQKALTGVRR
jgi:hypothetical protein